MWPPPQACLDHMITAEEQEQLAFLVAAGGRNDHRCVSWFLHRHLQPDRPDACDPHLADLCLWALVAAQATGTLRPQLWEQLFAAASGQTQLAFVFAARQPGYARVALASAASHRERAHGRVLKMAQTHWPGGAADFAAQLRVSVRSVPGPRSQPMTKKVLLAAGWVSLPPPPPSHQLLAALPPCIPALSSPFLALRHPRAPNSARQIVRSGLLFYDPPGYDFLGVVPLGRCY